MLFYLKSMFMLKLIGDRKTSFFQTSNKGDIIMYTSRTFCLKIHMSTSCDLRAKARLYANMLPTIEMIPCHADL